MSTAITTAVGQPPLPTATIIFRNPQGAGMVLQSVATNGSDTTWAATYSDTFPRSIYLTVTDNSPSTLAWHEVQIYNTVPPDTATTDMTCLMNGTLYQSCTVTATDYSNGTTYITSYPLIGGALGPGAGPQEMTVSDGVLENIISSTTGSANAKQTNIGKSESSNYHKSFSSLY
jgi:hypothetical protein